MQFSSSVRDDGTSVVFTRGVAVRSVSFRMTSRGVDGEMLQREILTLDLETALEIAAQVVKENHEELLSITAVTGVDAKNVLKIVARR